MKKHCLLFFACAVFSFIRIEAQVAINNDGSPPDPSAILDLQTNDKGLLLPRIDYNDRPDPAVPGLLIFVTANGPLGNNALYLFDGNNWQKITGVNTSGVGAYIEGGIVFWADENQGFKLVSALDDQNGSEWGCFGTLIGPDAQHTEIGMGDANTGAIINSCLDEDIAAFLCDTLTLNGYTDWFLPSRDELLEMYTQRTLIGGFSNFLYWTSTESADAEFPEEAAWIVNFTDGTNGWTSKAGVLNVRCIRKVYSAAE